VSIEQAVAGSRVGVGDEAVCIYCKGTVREGATATVYAYRLADEGRWSVARLYCGACDRTAVEHPSRGCDEVIARGRLGVTSDCATQSSYLSLIGVSVIDHSPPIDGGRLR
jgi:hypothetical protein